MEQNLKFIATMSVAEFKRQQHITKIDVIRNPHTDKRFFQASDNTAVSGKVALAWEPSDDTVISQVCPKEGPDAGISFFMLHKRQESSDNLLHSL